MMKTRKSGKGSKRGAGKPARRRKPSDIFEPLYHEVPASKRPFDPGKVFRVGGSKLPISCMNPKFERLVARAGVVRRPFLRSKLFSRTLRLTASARRIIWGLGGIKKATTSLRELAHFLMTADQSKGYIFVIGGVIVCALWLGGGWAPPRLPRRAPVQVECRRRGCLSRTILKLIVSRNFGLQTL